MLRGLDLLCGPVATRMDMWMLDGGVGLLQRQYIRVLSNIYRLLEVSMVLHRRKWGDFIIGVFKCIHHP